LYDSDYEDDKLYVVQSVTLLGFWYSDPEDRHGPSHWMGIAIGLCQVMGLYRTPRSSGSLSPYANLRTRLFRRIWWSCFMRDRWLCLALGRPMRINLEDCQVQMPEPEDITMELGELAPDVAAKYLPAAMQEQAEVWVRLIHLSVTLGKILRQHTRTPLDHDCFQSCETDLEGYRSSARGPDHQTDFSMASLNEFQFELLRQFVPSTQEYCATFQKLTYFFSLPLPERSSSSYIGPGSISETLPTASRQLSGWSRSERLARRRSESITSSKC
jgi:hypothetical protein